MNVTQLGPELGKEPKGDKWEGEEWWVTFQRTTCGQSNSSAQHAIIDPFDHLQPVT